MGKFLQHTGKKIAECGEYTIIECESCGFAHCLPIPEHSELESAYKDDYYSTVKPDYIEKAEKDRAWHELTCNSRLSVIETLTSGRKMLEIGSGPGIFLDCARSRGWEVMGFEPSKQAWLYSTEILGLNVRNDFFGPEAINNLFKFDAIHLGLVLEHIPNPLELISVVKACLNPGGVVCVAVPNDFNKIQDILHTERGFSKWWVAPPHHINYFNHTSLAQFLQQNGLEVMKQETTFPLDLFLLLGFNYTQDDNLGRQCHSLRMQFEQELEKAGLCNLRNDLYDVFMKYGLGRLAVVYAVFNG